MSDTDLTIKLSAIDQLTPAILKAVSTLDSMNQKLDGMGKTTTKTSESTAGLHGGLISLAAGLETGKMAVEALKIAWEVLAEPMEKAIEEALAAEKAHSLLVGALISAGTYTHQTAEELSQYAEKVGEASGVNSSLIKTHIALGIQMGLSAQKAKEMEEASRKLAVVTGGDEESAFRTLQQSLAGHSRSLSLVIPQVKEFGAAQLQQGAAIDLVNKSLNAQYNEYQESLPGALSKAKTAYNELYKAFGSSLIASPALKGATQGIVSVMQQLSHWFVENSATIKEWVSNSVIVAIESLGALNEVFDVVGRGGKIAFDGIVLALQSVALGIVTVVGGPIDLLFKALSKLPGMGDTFANMSKFIEDTASDLSASVGKSFESIVKDGTGQLESTKLIEGALIKVLDAANQAEAGQNKLSKSMEEGRQAATSNAAAIKDLVDVYAGFEVGNEAERLALAAQKQDRDKDLKDFKAYFDEKIQDGIDYETEEQANATAYQAQQLQTRQGFIAAEIAQESRRQEQLEGLLDSGLVTADQYNDAVEEAGLAHEQKMQDILDKSTTEQANREGVNNVSIMATRQKFLRDNEKAQATSQKQILSGAMAMQTTQKALGDTFNKLGAAMIHSQKVTAEGMVGIFLESFGTQVQQKGFGDIAMSIFPPNPAGLAAGAGEVAIGTVIGRIGAGMQGGQAHGGMDEIPSSLDNKSFLLSGGERVVQPEANKDLKNFLADQKDSKSSGSGKAPINATINLTVNGTASKDDMRKTAEMLIPELRRMSERGDQVLSVKGVY